MTPKSNIGHRGFALLALLLIGFSFPLLALDPHKTTTQYGQSIWIRANGLPANSVNAIIQSRDGFLWLGTSAGLFRFDGVSFVEVGTDPSNAGAHESITTLLETGDGSIWIGTAYDGLIQIKDGKVTRHGLNEDFFDTNVRDLLETRKGHLIIGTATGVFLYHDGRFLQLTMDQNFISGLAEDSLGRVWVGTLDGIRIFDDDGTTSPKILSFRNGLPYIGITTIHSDQAGDMWVGTYGGLGRWSSQGSTVYSSGNVLSNDHINSVYEDKDRNLWVATQRGLDRLSGGTWSVLTKSEGLTDNEVLSVCEDREGSLWIGTADGLNQFKDASITSYTTNEGLGNDHVSSIVQTPDGSLFFFSDQAPVATRLKENRFTTFSNVPGGPAFGSRDGSIWLGQSGVLLNFRNGKLKRFDSKSGIPAKWISAITEDSQSLIFYADHAGLFRFRDGVVQPYLMKNGKPYPSKDYIACFCRQGDNILWLGMGDSLVKIESGVFTSYTKKDGLAGNWVSSFFDDGRENLWISSPQGGLTRYREGKFTAYSTKVGLFSDEIYCVLGDDAGNVWLSSARGIGFVQKRELDDFAEGRTKTIHSIVYGAADGMKTDVCFGQWQPAGCKTPDGKLWFATKRGTVLIDPKGFRRNELAPPVFIERFIAGDSDLPTDKDASLSSGTEKLEFHYTALSFIMPQRVLFKYMLEGYDRTWVDAGPRREAYYTHLLHGNYRFRVMACNNDGVWNEAGDSFAFEIHPHFYETFWFLCCMILLLGGSTFAFYRFRVWRLLQRETILKGHIQEALASIKVLGGLIPICSNCKKIRNDKGYWDLLEGYIQSHSEAKFSHGLCPDCAQHLYPKIFGDEGKR